MRVGKSYRVFFNRVFIPRTLQAAAAIHQNNIIPFPPAVFQWLRPFPYGRVLKGKQIEMPEIVSYFIGYPFMAGLVKFLYAFKFLHPVKL